MRDLPSLIMKIQLYLGSTREGSRVIVEVFLAVSMANCHNARSGVNRVCPISNGLTAVAVRGNGLEAAEKDNRRRDARGANTKLLIGGIGDY
jgi:hypothetical protein